VEEVGPEWIPWLTILDDAYPPGTSPSPDQDLDLSDPIYLLFTKTYLRQNQVELNREVMEGEAYPIVCIPREKKSDFLAQFELKFDHLPFIQALKEERENDEEEDQLTQASRQYTEYDGVFFEGDSLAYVFNIYCKLQSPGRSLSWIL
jgi:hypothetical protein